MPDHPADLLRQAAQQLRDYATAAVPGPWVPSIVRSPRSTVTSGIYSHAHPAGSAASEIAASGRKGRECGGITNADNAQYIALMHPGVGLLVADWLDSAATDAEMVGPDVQALAVARAVLGQDGGTR
ncbi:hypothetical protein ACFVFS_17475 [Kitasatospora sp. NPDC057692]|uniref:hypothetical protein n=1 Tax=Kitasatospora sp. NPDC057692 TaxID=3346215 RepID=UPI003678442C